MRMKKVSIQLEVSDSLATFVKIHSQMNGIDLDETYSKLLNDGISSGALNLNDALLKGATQQNETIKSIAQINRLTSIVDKKNPTAIEAEKILTKNVEQLKDDELIGKITKNLTKGK